MKKTTLLRSLIPALIVAVVLASSFVISAGAHQSSSHDKDNKCGYGYGQTDNDENDNNQKGQHANNTNANERNEKDCNEDENDEGGDHGDGGQGDQDHNDRQGDHDVSARPGEK